MTKTSYKLAVLSIVFGSIFLLLSIIFLILFGLSHLYEDEFESIVNVSVYLIYALFSVIPLYSCFAIIGFVSAKKSNERKVKNIGIIGGSFSVFSFIVCVAVYILMMVVIHEV